MKNTVCNSFYDKDELTEPTTVLLNNSTAKKVLETVPEKTVVPKKKSTLWIWAASYFAAVLISPRENINYPDNNVKSNL